jgi:transcriptional regulator with XRE-family HTH domain
MGSRIRQARSDKGWTQQELADRLAERGLPMSVPTLLRLEKGPRNGGRSISLQEWLTLAAVLEVPPLLLLLPLGATHEVAVTNELRMHPHLALDWIVGDAPPGHNPSEGRAAPFAIGDVSAYYAAGEPLRAWRTLREAQSAFTRAEVRYRSAAEEAADPLDGRPEVWERKRAEAWQECERLAPAFRDALLRVRSHGLPPAYGRAMVVALARALGERPDELVAQLGLELLDEEGQP